MAVPVGDETEDEVLPGIQLNEEEKWKGFFYLQMIANCPKEKVYRLLQYRYESPSAVEEILKSMGHGASISSDVFGMLGVIIGGVEGMAAGTLLGPVAALVGAAGGGLMGRAVGTVTGGLTFGAIKTISIAFKRLTA